MVLNYDKVENLNRITVNGAKADLSEFSLKELVNQLNSDNIKSGGFFSFNGKIDNMILKNNISLNKVNISVNNQRNISVNISAFLDGNRPLRVYYNYPVLSITSPDAGSVLKALGITEKIGEGNLEIANKLDLKMSTVSTYKNRIFEKLKVIDTSRSSFHGHFRILSLEKSIQNGRLSC